MRKELEITLQDRGKDIVFVIKEMPALQLEKWLMKALLALCGSRNFEAQSTSKGHTKTTKELLDSLFEGRFLEVFCNTECSEIEPLLDELLTCVQRRVDNGLMQVNSNTIESYIEDVRTLFNLRMEVLKLNLDFLLELNQEAQNSEEQKGKKIPFPSHKAKFQAQATSQEEAKTKAHTINMKFPSQDM